MGKFTALGMLEARGNQSFDFHISRGARTGIGNLDDLRSRVADLHFLRTFERHFQQGFLHGKHGCRRGSEMHDGFCIQILAIGGDQMDGR